MFIRIDTLSIIQKAIILFFNGLESAENDKVFI